MCSAHRRRSDASQTASREARTPAPERGRASPATEPSRLGEDEEIREIADADKDPTPIFDSSQFFCDI